MCQPAGSDLTTIKVFNIRTPKPPSRVKHLFAVNKKLFKYTTSTRDLKNSGQKGHFHVIPSSCWKCIYL